MMRYQARVCLLALVVAIAGCSRDSPSTTAIQESGLSAGTCAGGWLQSRTFDRKDGSKYVCGLGYRIAAMRRVQGPIGPAAPGVGHSYLLLAVERDTSLPSCFGDKPLVNNQFTLERAVAQYLEIDGWRRLILKFRGFDATNQNARLWFHLYHGDVHRNLQLRQLKSPEGPIPALHLWHDGALCVDELDPVKVGSRKELGEAMHAMAGELGWK